MFVFSEAFVVGVFDVNSLGTFGKSEKLSGRAKFLGGAKGEGFLIERFFILRFRAPPQYCALLGFAVRTLFRGDRIS